MNTSTLSTRPTDQTKKKLDQLAKAAARSMAFLVAKAVQSYIEEQAWQIRAIKEVTNGRIFFKSRNNTLCFQKPFFVPFTA